MPKRPEFTIAQITEQFNISRSTVRRGLVDSRFPNAKKDHHGRWLIPVDDVLQAGFTPRKTWLNEGVHEADSQGSHEPSQPAQNGLGANEHAGLMNQAHLENELAHERAQVDKLKALLDAERAHVESLRMALRMIESGTNTPAKEVAATPAQTTPEPPSTAPKQRLFQRLFKSRNRPSGSN